VYVAHKQPNETRKADKESPIRKMRTGDKEEESKAARENCSKGDALLSLEHTNFQLPKLSIHLIQGLWGIGL